MEQEELLHLRLEGQRDNVIQAAVAPAGVLLVFPVSNCVSMISTSVPRRKSIIFRFSLAS